jgi:hypothetical protein
MHGKWPAAKACKAKTSGTINLLLNKKTSKQMETKKMSLANVQGKLSRAEMKNVMAGDESVGGGTCFLRCDQTTTVGIEVTDCSRATMEANCTGDTKPVCVC